MWTSFGNRFRRVSLRVCYVLLTVGPPGWAQDATIIDAGFNPGTGADGDIFAVALQADGRILIAGRFTSVAGQSRGRIARLNSEGTLDPTFNPGSGANNNIRTLLVLDDGSILVGGQFTNYNGIARSRIARLQADGAVDPG